MNRFTKYLLTMTLLAGCGADDSTAPANPAALAPEGFDIPVVDRDAPLPAFQSQAEKDADKADRFDTRGNYQDIYGATPAPRGGVRSIAEFENTDAVLVSWDDWQEEFITDLVAATAEAAPVYVLTDSISESQYVQGRLLRGGANVNNVAFFEFSADSFWTRDYGPVPVIQSNGEPAFVDQQYYPNRRRDDAVPTLLGRYFEIDTYRPDMATEGGNFMTNGLGLCVVTEWLLQENFGLSETQINRTKRDFYGCQDLVILERMDGEGTGHVDMFAKFVSEDTVLVGQYSASADPANARILDRNAQRLSSLRLDDGRPLRVVRIPMPAGGGQIYRSYTNSLIVNDTVVVPIYMVDRRFENQALDIYRRTMPGYRVVTVEADSAIEMGGAVHCTTMGFNLNPLSAPTPVDPTPIVEPSTPSADFTSSPRAAIRDLQDTNDIIQVPDRGDAGDLTVTLDIDHTYIGDLDVFLVHGGVIAQLHAQEGGSADGIQRTYSVQTFDGMNRQGEWGLVVRDNAREDEGVLNNWTLSFE